jgi:hypothetical protein
MLMDREDILDKREDLLQQGEEIEYYQEVRMGFQYRTKITPTQLLDSSYFYRVVCSVDGSDLVLKGSCSSIPQAIAVAEELEGVLNRIRFSKLK